MSACGADVCSADLRVDRGRQARGSWTRGIARHAADCRKGCEIPASSPCRPAACRNRWHGSWSIGSMTKPASKPYAQEPCPMPSPLLSSLSENSEVERRDEPRFDSGPPPPYLKSEEHTSALHSLMS